MMVSYLVGDFSDEFTTHPVRKSPRLTLLTLP